MAHLYLAVSLIYSGPSTRVTQGEAKGALQVFLEEQRQ